MLTEKDVTSDSGSTTDTSLDNKFMAVTIPQKKHSSSKRLPQLCPVYNIGVKSKGALTFHLKTFHPTSRSYYCLDCESAFNNTADLAGHNWSIHSSKNVSCKHCSYRTTSKTRMQIHVCIHTLGMHCKKCGQSYPNSRSLCEHSKLHGKRLASICSVCDKKFATDHSLRIHVKGNHDDGYRCICGESFSSPVQCVCHKQKCQHKG